MIIVIVKLSLEPNNQRLRVRYQKGDWVDGVLLTLVTLEYGVFPPSKRLLTSPVEFGS